jgi:hypothetical protein
MPEQCFNNFGAGKISANGELLFLKLPTIYWFLSFSLYKKVLTPTSFVWGEGKLCLIWKDFYTYKISRDTSFLLPLLRRSRPKIPPFFLGGIFMSSEWEAQEIPELYCNVNPVTQEGTPPPLLSFERTK